MTAPTVVVLRALGLGDTVTGLPALRMLRDALPQHRIVLATPRRWAPIVERAATVDEIVDTGELQPITGVASTPERPVELAVDLHGNGPASRRLLDELGPRRVLAYDDGPVPWRHAEHEVDRWCRLLRDGLPAVGVPAAGRPAVDQPGLRSDGAARAFPPLTGALGPPPRLAAGGGADAGATVVHVGAAAPSRRWPPGRFAAVAMLLAGGGHRVVVTGGPGEEAIAHEVARGARVPVRTGLDVEGLLALVGAARLVVSGDTGVAHVASAYGVPSVTLFGPVSPVRWGPPVHPRHQVLWHGDDTGDPHGAQPDPALLQITVGEVIAASRVALRAGPALHPPPRRVRHDRAERC